MIAELVLAIAALRSIEAIRYRRLDLAEGLIAERRIGPLVKSSDVWIELVTLVCVWFEAALMFEVGALLPPGLAVLPVALLVAGRMRAVQEIGHTALHLGFGETKRTQWLLADWLGNYMTFKANSTVRFQGHCVEHHPHANTEDDPNIKRLRRIGFVPGLSKNKFRALLFWPFTWGGLKETATMFKTNSGKGVERLIRIALLSAVLSALGLRYGAWAPVTWMFALAFVYPLYSWWSLLAEHRWYEDNREEDSFFSHACDVTPRTLYSGASGALIRYLISPCTDSLHLAHHIYPRLHWRYLPIADRLLESDPAYAKHTKTTLFGEGPRSVIGDLEKRMTA